MLQGLSLVGSSSFSACVLCVADHNASAIPGTLKGSSQICYIGTRLTRIRQETSGPDLYQTCIYAAFFNRCILSIGKVIYVAQLFLLVDNY